ncbi:unnamed protein product, partial [Mesorhabditis belari]|uniref:DUF4781 domain-containing protein n=1 Tax=Mesorhabditis belari TaxID=2138241 RepID=A0AAF3EIE5_9BILA
MVDQPEDVILPKGPDDSDGFRKHDWEDKELQKWLEEAKGFQQAHYNDNERTERFRNERSTEDGLMLRLCVISYGMRPGYSSLLQAYSKAEKAPVKDMIKTMKKNCKGAIEFNIVYVSIGVKQDDGTFGDREIPLIRLTASKKVIDMSDPGCLYRSYRDYLDKNKLEPSVILYPENGTYAEKKVQLKACESNSCTFFSDVVKVAQFVVTVVGVATTIMTPLCMLGGPALAAMSARVAVTGSFWAASLIRAGAVVATASRYLSVANTITSWAGVVFAGMGIYQKLGRGETCYGEVMTMLTFALNKAQEMYARRVRNAILVDGLTWGEWEATLSPYDKLLYFTARLLPMITSSVGLAVTFYQLLMNPYRTMYEVTSFSISLFMFTNTLVRPWTLHALFETTVGDITNELRSRFKPQNEDEKRGQERFEEDLRNASEKEKIFMIKNCYRIEDLPGFYTRMSNTRSTVKYNKNGFILNRNVELAPEKWNEVGRKDFILGQLLERKETSADLDKSVKTLMEDYDPDLVEDAQKFVKGQLTEEEKKAFMGKLDALEQNRKDKLFQISADYKEATDLLGSTERAERDLAGGKTLEEWRIEKKELEARRDATTDPQAREELNREIADRQTSIEQAQKIRNDRSAYLKSFLEPPADDIISQNEQKMKQANETMRELIKHYDPKVAQKFANEKMTKQEIEAFVADMEPRHQERFLQAEGERQEAKAFRDTVDTAEKGAANGKTCEEWNKEKRKFENMREQANKQPSPDQQKIDDLNAKIKESKANIEKAQQAQVDLNKTLIRDRETDFSRQMTANDGDFEAKTRDFLKGMSTFRRQEDITTVVNVNIVKHSLQNAFGVTNYKDILVNGQPIFAQTTDLELMQLSGIFDNPQKAKMFIDVSTALINSSDCYWKGNDSKELGAGMKLLNQYAMALARAKVPAEDPGYVLSQILQAANSEPQGAKFIEARDFFNDVKSSVEEIYKNNPKCVPFGNPYTAYAHFMKHDSQGGVTIKEALLTSYLIEKNDMLFNRGLMTQQYHSQDGQFKYRSYISKADAPRTWFGATATPTNGKTPVAKTQMEK